MKEENYYQEASKITKKDNEMHDNEFPDKETSYLIGSVFLTGGMEIADLQNIGWFPLLFLTPQHIPRKYISQIKMMFIH